MIDRAIALRVFPRDDGAFQADAESAMDGAPTPAGLQRALRARYPAAVVRPREDIADPGFGPAVWYVYRYGSARPVGRWWTEQSYPWAVLDDQRRFVDLELVPGGDRRGTRGDDPGPAGGGILEPR